LLNAARHALEFILMSIGNRSHKDLCYRILQSSSGFERI